MKKQLTKIFILITIIFYSCDTADSPPPLDDETTFEFTWTVDTLKNPNGYGVVPWSTWGSSSQSVWVAGFNLANQGEIFHYNGNTWERVTPDLGFNYQVTSVFGFSENDVYIAGAKLIIDSVLHGENLLLHYDGVSFQEINLPKGNGLLYIHGRNTNDIWTCGYYGSLYHKTGTQWVKVSFDEREYLGLLSETPDLGPIYVAPNGEVFIMNEYYDYKVYGDTAMFYFSKYSNSSWKDLDSCRMVNIDGIRTGYTFGNKSVWGYNEYEIYSAGNAVYNFNGNSWVPATWDDYPYRDIKGTLSNKIFVVGEHGTLRYYNGNDWIRVRKYSNTIVDFYSVMPFEDEIFIGAYQLGEGYVVRGKVIK
ncbi:MAG: hypothetical protein K8F60_03655 [Melioribacteraceae bacterium]|nr:hypothetical protein [Melioribacteraceae bacterium]